MTVNLDEIQEKLKKLCKIMDLSEDVTLHYLLDAIIFRIEYTNARKVREANEEYVRVERSAFDALKHVVSAFEDCTPESVCANATRRIERLHNILQRLREFNSLLHDL